MKLQLNAFAAILCLGMVVNGQNDNPSFIPSGSQSILRQKEAEVLSMSYFKSHGTGEDSIDIADSLSKAFLVKCPGVKMSPAEAVLTVSQCEASAKARLIASSKKEYPVLSREELQAEAEKKYPLYKKGDKIKVNYMANPVYPSSVEGTYYGTQGGQVRIGKHRIRLADMAGIENNEVEILKFDAERTTELRNNLIEKMVREADEKRKEYVETNDKNFFEAELKTFAQRNETAGYTFYNGKWYGALPFLTLVVTDSKVKYNNMLQIAREKELAACAAAVEAQAGSFLLRGDVSPAKERLNPAEVLRAQELEAKNKAEAAAKKLAEEEARKQKAEEAARLRAEEAEKAKLAAERAKKAKAKAVEEPLAEEEGMTTKTMIIIFAVVFAACVVIALIIFKIQKNRDKDRFTKFFEGKGKLQKDFWEMAEADPEHFKYVAYMFPGLKEASAALQKLTYIQATPNGELRCSRDIYFGVYPHLDGAVAFVGGVNFHYAPWREATAVLPELPGASYFKVSTEPEVMLDVPDIEKMAADKNVKIENLGIEEIADPEGGFTRCYKYRADSKDSAMAFLEDFQVNEEGIVIHVETPEGIFCKEENGIFSV